MDSCCEFMPDQCMVDGVNADLFPVFAINHKQFSTRGVSR